MPVQAVAGNPVQNPMQPYPTQVVMNQQILQQQPQASDMRQDASTPQPHHVTQFIPSVGFTPDNASFYYSPHANIAQPPSLMSGQQQMSFSPYLPRGPSQVNHSPLQTPLSQAPSKHGINKPYISNFLLFYICKASENTIIQLFLNMLHKNEELLIAPAFCK